MNNVKEMLEKGYTAEQLQEELSKEIDTAQKEIKKAADNRNALVEKRKTAVTAAIDYLYTLGALEKKPTDDRIKEIVKAIADSEDLIKDTLPNIKIVREFDKNFRDPFEHIWSSMWPW